MQKEKRIKSNDLSWEDCEPKSVITVVKCRHSSSVRIFRNITTVNALNRVFTA